MPVSRKSLQAGDRAPEDERVNIVGAFVCIHRFEIGEVAHDGEGGGNSIGAQHVAGHAGDIERLACIVALDERDCFRGKRARIQHPADAQGGLKPERDFGFHVGEFFLDQLISGERPAELLTLECIGSCRIETSLRRPHGAPADAVSRMVEAAKRSLEPRGIRQEVFSRHFDTVHDNPAGWRGAQR